MLTFRRPCTDHRAALYAYVDRREIGPGTAAALGHLDRCRSCEQELSGVALTVVGLDRLRREVDAVEPPLDAWLRLLDRVERPRHPWRWRASLGSLATSAMLVAVLVMPVAMGVPATAESGPTIPGPLGELRREAEYLASIRAGTLPPPPPRDVRDDGSVPRFYPPEIAQVRKEVQAQPAVGRSSQPI